MRFRKRLSAAILAIVMMISSIQIPGGISYAAEMADSGIESGQNVSVLTAEDTEDTEAEEAKNSTADGTLTGDDSPAGDDNQSDDGNQTGDDSQTDNENVSEEETDAGQVSDDDTEEPILSVDTEETETEGTEIVGAEIEGAYQFGDMPSVSEVPSASDTPSAVGEIPEFSISTYEVDNRVEDYVYQQMLQREDCIDLYEGGFNNVSTSDVGGLVSGVINEHPDLYFVGKGISYGHGADSETIRYLYMTYSTDYDDAAFKKKTEAALECVEGWMSDDMKAIALHDYLVINVEYDYDNYLANSIPTDSYNAYGALVNGTAVCNGYMLAYKYLLNQVGIECYMVISPSMDHGWNMVKLDGEYYHVDTTWDDPTWDMVGKVCHTNLLRSDKNLERHYGWTITSGSSEVAYTATDTKYENAFWVDCTSPLVIDGFDCYYISKTSKNEISLKKADFSNFNDLGTDVVSIEIWTNGPDGYWLGAYSGLYMINGRLFYNDENSIYSIKPDGTDKKTEFTPEEIGSNQIYYSAYRNGKVVYALQTSPNLSGKQTVLTAKIEIPPQKVGLNAENLDFTFTTLDDETVSSRADGKPKMLFFFSTTCPNCWATHKSIVEHIEVFGDVDIYAIGEINRATKEDVAEYKEKFGCDEITYCYDKDQMNGSYSLRYGSITGWKGTTPHIVYIDSENLVQIGSTTALWIEILEILQKYCGYGEVAYKITYELNGGTNDSTNPDTYTPTKTITLADAVREEGYIFRGWYMDAEFNKRVKQIVEGSSGDITLYARWERKTYKITYELNGGANNEDNPSTYTVETPAIVLKDPTPRAGYEYGGWYKDEEFEEKVTEIPEGSTGDITLYAKWTKIGEGLCLPNFDYTYAEIDGTMLSSKADGKPKLLVFFSHSYGDGKETMQNITEDIYSFSGVDVNAIDIKLSQYVDETKSTREYKEAYGCDEIKFVYETRDYPTNYNKAMSYQQAGYQNAEGLTASICLPLICYIDKDNVLQWVSNYDQTSEQILANLKKYCGYYTPEDQGIYKITYKLNGGTNDSANPDTYTAETETITLKSAVKDGYKFDGWYKDADFREKVTEIVKGSTGKITLYAKWRKTGLNAENPDYTFTTLDDETVSSRADGKPKVLFFFRQSASYCQDMSQDLSQHIEYFNGVDIYAIEVAKATGEVVAQFKSVYGCDEITFCYDTGDTNRQCYNDYVDIAGFDYSGVPFAVYIDSENRVQYAELGGVSYTKVLAYLRDYCDYRYEDSAGTYKITYNLNGGTNSSENPATYTSETETITLKDAVKEGFIFEGWYKDSTFTESSKLTEIVKGSKGNIMLYAKWKKAEMNVSIQKPDKTTYKAGQTLEVAGGKVILTGKSDESVKVEKDITLSMISGFDSSAAGICNVMVTCDGYTGHFDVLIVEEPELIASYGQKIKELPLPESDYGTYAWADGVDTEIVVDWTGTQTFAAVFTPNDTENFNILEDLQISVAVKTELSPEYVQIEFFGGPYTYNKTDIEPEVKVTFSKVENTDGEEAETLVKGTDYELSYVNNIHAGTAKVIVTGINSYYGSIEKTFTIQPKELVIRALDKVILIGAGIPTEYEYDAEGIMDGDELIKAPEFTCEITSTEEEGEYDIIPGNADAGKNYRIIRYEIGVLHVVSGLLTCKVIFNMQEHGTAPTGYVGIQVGSTIDRPADPKAEGYRFDGWYQDAACTKAWNFETDIVQSDITLYAKWLALDSDSDLAVQEIADVYYNGKAQKPVVSVYDQDKLLKAGKDYQIKYYNNINANADGVRSKSGEFNDKLPYVEITGKGNYKDSVKINFNILKSPIEDAYGNPAPGVTLKVNDHLVKSAKALTPFGSINYGKKLKADTDYELTLTSLNVHDASGNLVNSETYLGAQIPADYTGEFLLTVEGRGNYTGSITRSVYVADKNHLMKNVKITLGKNLKNVEYTGESIEFTPADKQKPGNDEFVVTCGKKVLTPNEDYSVSYKNNTGVGKAELVVVGKGEYVGKKSVTFNIKGKTFSNGTVDVTGLNDKAYTGRAITQNKEAVLKWKADGKELVYGTDYTISYSRNINKGTATVTFTGMAEGGYNGKVSKKFKITAADISDETRVTRAVSMQAITLPYSKAGVKPVGEIILTSAGGTRLQNGKDYTLTYKNNKAVAATSGDKAPTVTVKGKGNYSGTFDVKFTIEKADLNGSGIVIECAPVAYNSKKTGDYAYKPAVKVKDGKAALKAGKDYEISYVNNTQADYNNYLEKLKLGSVVDDGEAADDYIPMAVITGKEGSSYTVQGSIKVPLQIYMTKFKKSNLDVQIDTAVYTGGQVKPNVTVRYKGESGDILLEQGVDYTLEYGVNSASGKNKGSVTVKGLAPDYGGSVTYKFEIVRKDLKYWNLPEIDEK